ncbi:MAG: hypothetical protein ABJV04_10140 [Aliiglaciecola sp.]|uniref:hypothetical protein n=1 Tax=unclassified Aliiglaciecola TaxID=2593648 RepID=UPI0026E21A34|nr:hypothetical protein [Aliiglaciecola sp. 3_MG-2023]MDO6692166.1 hypothetical protein [Aliiglaciecola sp. 3_MG-2023]
MVDAVLFGITVLVFVLGTTCLIMGFLPSPAGGMREKVEYGFFGVTGLVATLLLSVAIAWS